VLTTVAPGERVANYNPGGGGFGPAWERPPEEVREDVRNGLVSRDGAALDYGVVLDAAGDIDRDATQRLRARMAASATRVADIEETPAAA